MDKVLEKELRKILVGRVIRSEEGWLIALPEKSGLVFHGVTDGWESAQFRKLISRESYLRISDNGEDAFHTVFSALQNMGRLVHLESDPDSLACICRYVLTKTVVLRISPLENGGIRVCAHTGKSLLAGLSCQRALRDFKRALPPGEIQEIDPVPEESTPKEKKKSRAEKADVEKKRRMPFVKSGQRQEKKQKKGKRETR